MTKPASNYLFDLPELRRMQLGYSKNEANKSLTVFTVWAPKVIERSSVVTQFSWDCTAAAVSYGPGTLSTIFPGFHINFRVKSVSLPFFQIRMFLDNQISLPLLIYNTFTGSNQSPFIDLQYFYGVKSVSPFRITMFSQGQISFPLSIYNILRDKFNFMLVFLAFYTFHWLKSLEYFIKSK